jgi:hypothetical protein
MSPPLSAFARRWRCLGCTLVITALMLVGCTHGASDRRAQADQLTADIRSMPGVLDANGDLTDDFPAGNVHFWLSVDVRDDVTADQAAAVAARYLDGLRGGDFTGYFTELDVRHGDDLFTVDSAERAVTNTDQIVGDARDWVAIRHEFSTAAVTLRSAVTHPKVARPIDADLGHPALGTVEFPDPADYQTVGNAVTTLSAHYPRQAAGTWTVDAGKSRQAAVTSSQRWPTPAELDVWRRLNADQSIPHVDALYVNAPQAPPAWFSEKLLSHDPALAVALATSHLPIVAMLPRPVLYTATDQIQGHRDFYAKTMAPLAITLGGCTTRGYPPGPDEQRFIATYETCKT